EHDRGAVSDDISQELGPGVLKAIADGERMQIPGDVETEREPENLARAESAQRNFWRIALQEAQVLFQHLAERPIRCSCSVREAAAGAPQRFGVLLRKAVPEFAGEPRLADTCIAENGHEPRPPLLDGSTVGPKKAFKLLVAADERARKAADPARPHQRERAHQPSRYDAVRFPLRRDRRRLLELEGATRRGDGAFADED